MKCQQCGTVLSPSDRICPQCHARVSPQSPFSAQPSGNTVEFDIPAVPAVPPPPVPGPGQPSATNSWSMPQAGRAQQPPDAGASPEGGSYSEANAGASNRHSGSGRYSPYGAEGGGSNPTNGGYGPGGHPPPGGYGYPTGDYSPYSSTSPSARPNSGKTITIVLSIVGVVILGFIGIVAFAVLGLSSQIRSESSHRSQSTTNIEASTDVRTKTDDTDSTPTSSGDATINESDNKADSSDAVKEDSDTEERTGVEDGLTLVDVEKKQVDGGAVLTGHVRNTSEHMLHNVVIDYDLLDADGKVVGHASDRIEELPKGQEWTFSAAMDLDSYDYKLNSLESD